MTMNEEQAVYYFTAFKGFRRGPVCVIGGKTSRGGRGLKKRKRKKKRNPASVLTVLALRVFKHSSVYSSEYSDYILNTWPSFFFCFLT